MLIDCAIKSQLMPTDNWKMHCFFLKTPKRLRRQFVKLSGKPIRTTTWTAESSFQDSMICSGYFSSVDADVFGALGVIFHTRKETDSLKKTKKNIVINEVHQQMTISRSCLMCASFIYEDSVQITHGPRLRLLSRLCVCRTPKLECPQTWMPNQSA